MNLSIKYKIFLAILSAHIIVYASMYSIGRYSFASGFLDYVSRIEERQVPELVAGLADYYTHTGSWATLKEHPRTWVALLRDSIESSVDATLPTAQVTRPTPGGFSPNDWYYSSEYSPARPYLSLLDVDKNIIFGERQALPLANLNPISVSGQTVGYLAVTSRQVLTEQADVLFFEQQSQSFFLIAVVLVFISALAIAFPVSTVLVRPIKEIVAGTRSLTNGDYSSHIKIHGADELGQLSKDFNTLAKTLEQNRVARQQWIADISHELRTPLAILQGELEAVQDGIRPLNPETLDSLHHEVTHLNSLITDLHELSLSDIGALVYEKKEIDLSQLLSLSVEVHQQLTQQGKIKVTTEITPFHPNNPILMLADKTRLEQLFTNLMQNTCRYTNAGGELFIKLKENQNNIVLEWYDSERGVSDADLEHLFERLYRVESSRNRAKGGSGLGLAISKNIIDAHDGIITAEHSTLGGLKLTIKFPKALKKIS